MPPNSYDTLEVRRKQGKKLTASQQRMVELQEVRVAAAKLYGQGYKRTQIARILLDHLCTEAMLSRPEEQRLTAARALLRRWEKQDSFRDLLYKHALIELDLETPQVLKGIAKKAKRGRVDAARLVLELTGRHNPKGDQAPTQIVLQIEGVPRPVPQQNYDLELQASEEDEDS